MNQQRRADSESDSELNETVIGAPATTAPPQPQEASNNIAALVASITALRESINELRNETNTQRSDIQQLRQRVETDYVGNSQRPQIFRPPTNSQEAIVPGQNQQSPLPMVMPQPPTTLVPPNQPPVFMENAATRLYPLPIFEGNPEDWPLFIASYRDTTTEFNYSNRQNLMRLQRALKGDARQAVTSLLIYPEDVPSILKELEFNFGRPDLLVRAQLQKVQQFSNIPESRLDQILDLSVRVRNVVAFLKSARCQHHLMNPTLLDQLVTKLPPSKQYEWGKRVAEIGSYPTVENFSEWLSELATVISLMPKVADRAVPSTHTRQASQPVASSRQPAIAGGGTRRLLHSSEIPNHRRQPTRCPQCSQAHALSDCRQFASRNVNERWAMVKRQQLCFGCLDGGHNLLTCQRRTVCSINGCQRKHHKLLHAPNETTANQVEHVYNCRQESMCTLFKFVPVTLCGPRGKLETYAMFDEGSSISLISEKVATSLGLQGQSSLLSLQWYGRNKSTERSRKVSLEIRGPDSNFAIKNVRTIRNLNLPTQSFDKEKFSHLNKLSLSSYKSVKPELLLGLDNSFLSIANETIDNGHNQPIAAKTKLGWVVYGPTQSGENVSARVMVLKEATSLKQLHNIVEEYIAADTVAVKSPVNSVLESDDDSRAKKILQETTKCIENRYEVGLLWRKDDTKLPASYSMAQKRLLNIEARMRRDSQFAANYIREINKYVTKGYARQMSEEEAGTVKPTTWYLPHFGVVNAHKPEKLRIVFDAAATTLGTSLNSALLKGPEKVQSLLTILYKFRQGVVAVAGDIEEMFSQVKIRTEDQDSQRFLWRDGDPSQKIRVYAMTSLIFGAACSPCCAEYVKNANAAQFTSDKPNGVDAVVNKTYVDDLVISFSDAKEAEKTIKEAIEINAAAGFKLRRFVSNNKILQSRLNNANNAPAKIVNLERQATVDKILGMFWNTTTDAFEFHFKFFKIAKDVLHCKRLPTKRELLAIVMSIYDPFGLLTNVTISAKLLLQSLWKQGTAWDEELPQHLAAHWKTWWSKFQSVKSFSIPRCYSALIPNADDIQLHIFVDASATAYASAAYLRIQKGDAVEVALVCAKATCAPLKTTSVPRLELQAAVMGCRIKSLIEESLDIPINRTIFWSDSQTVILWIRSHTRAYKPYVAHRIAEILNTTTIKQWRWVPTAMNVADDATRAQPIPEFSPPTRWLKGPDFYTRTRDAGLKKLR